MINRGNAVAAPDELRSGIAELTDVLSRISRGDTTVRFPDPAADDIFRTVKEQINLLAEHIRQTNDEAHEMAIGLCEHYETLNQLAHGDFAARAATNSVNEVVAKMGELINLQADTLTTAISRAQQAEADNENQLQFLRVLVDTMPSPIFYKDAACRYLGCNSAFEAYVGLTRDDLVGKTPHEIWPAELADSYRQQDLALLEHPGQQTYEAKVRYADDTQRDVIFNKATFEGRDGAVAGLVGIIQDITERKTAEETLAFQNLLLTAQQEASIDGILVVDENNRILSYNRRFVEIMDIPANLLKTREDEPVLQYVTGRMADPQRFLDKVHFLYQHPQERCRDEITLSTGATLDRYTVPLLDANGRSYGRLWSFRDITERKAAEDTIRNAYQRLFDIIEFLPDPTFVVDKERRVIAWNRAIEQLTGVEKRDILGKGDYAYALPFYGDNRPLLIDLLEQEQERYRLNYKEIKQEGQTLFTEVFVPSFRNGDSRYFWATATPLFDQEGNPSGAIESIRDITVLKLAEQKRSRLEAQLQHGRMLETFMVRLSHDLRTPLTPLFVLLPLLKRRVADSELQGMLDLCQKGATVVKKMVDRAQMLVSLSTRPAAEELVLTPLVLAVEGALDDLFDSMAHKQVTCRIGFDNTLLVAAVPDQLKELFINLLANAVRFSPENGVIRITADQRAKMVTVTVHDDGVGLDAKNLERIFDEFFKADDSRHDLDAPGLGLSICKRIVLNHQGRIWAESPGLGKGTTIIFTLNENVDDDRQR